MTPERAMEIARSITESIYKEEIAQAILAACEAESNLAAAAMVEKCAEFVEAHAQAYPTLPDMLREFSPAGVLEAHDQAVRLEEALWWWKKSTGIHKLVECPCKYCQRLAALRSTPQPTAVKEEK